MVYDASAIRQFRLLITDPDGDMFTAEQVTDFLDLAAGNVKRAAARALLVIAASEVLISKKIRTQDLSTDGPAVAEALRKLAKDLLDEADAEDEELGTDFYYIGGPGRRAEGEEWRL